MCRDLNLKIILTCIIWLICAICLFFIVAVARVDASTNGILKQNNLTTPLIQQSGDSVILTGYTGNLNELAFMPIYTYNFKSNVTYNFTETFFFEITSKQMNLNLVCDDITMGAQILNGNRLGNQITISNRTWEQTNCAYLNEPLKNQSTITLAYTYKGTFTGINSSRVTTRHFLSTNKNTLNATIRFQAITMNIVPNDATNGDIIENNNYNSQNIINNNNQNTQNITNSIDDLNSSLTDTTSPDLNSLISGVISTNDRPISQLVLLPLTFINFYINSMSNACTTYTFGNLLGSDLKLTCIDFDDLLGSSLYHTIDLMMSIFIIYNLVLLIITAFNDITSLEDTFSSLYEPRHAKGEYQPRHAK